MPHHTPANSSHSYDWEIISINNYIKTLTMFALSMMNFYLSSTPRSPNPIGVMRSKCIYSSNLFITSISYVRNIICINSNSSKKTSKTSWIITNIANYRNIPRKSISNSTGISIKGNISQFRCFAIIKHIGNFNNIVWVYCCGAGAVNTIRRITGICWIKLSWSCAVAFPNFYPTACWILDNYIGDTSTISDNYPWAIGY